MFTTIGQNVVHFAEAGPAGAPAVVFVHSLGTDHRVWDRVVPALATDHRTLSYDLRGHGLSDAPAGPYRLDQLAEDLQGLVEERGVASAVLVGISIGGQIALECAARHPAAVRGLVLADTAARIGSVDGWNQRIDAVEASGLESIVHGVLERWFASSFRAEEPSCVQGFGHILSRMPVAGYVASCAALRDGDLTETARRVKMPALVLTGSEDQATTPEEGRALAGLLPNARFELLEGAAHLPCVEQPSRVAGAIRRFLEELGDG